MNRNKNVYLECNVTFDLSILMHKCINVNIKVQFQQTNRRYYPHRELIQLYTWLKFQCIVKAGIWILTGVIVLSPSPGYLSQLKCIMSQWQKLDSLMELLLVCKSSHQYRWSFPMSPVAKSLQGEWNSSEGDVME